MTQHSEGRVRGQPLEDALARAEEAARRSIAAGVAHRDELMQQLQTYAECVDRLNFASDDDEEDAGSIRDALASFDAHFQDLANTLAGLISRAEANLTSAYADLERNAPYVTIMLFGRTRAGKSTTMEALTRGDGRSIGHGRQHMTTEVKEYFHPRGQDGNPPEGPALRIVDTPGIDGFEGDDLAEMAESYIERADHIFFMLSDDKAGSDQLDRFRLIRTQGKGVTVLLNVKSEDGDLDLLRDAPEYVFKSEELDGHRRRIAGYLSRHFEMLEPPVVPFHARAAWLATRPEHLPPGAPAGSLLADLSRIRDVQIQIEQFIREDSLAARIRAPGDLVLGYITTVKDELRPFAGRFRQLVQELGALRTGLEGSVARARKRSLPGFSAIRAKYDAASYGVPSLVDELVAARSKGSALQVRWKRLLESNGAATAGPEFVSAAERAFIEEVQECARTAACDRDIVAPESVDSTIDGLYEAKDSTKNNKYWRAGMRAGGSGAAAALTTWAIVNWWNPSGWVAAVAAVGTALVGYGADKLVQQGTDAWRNSDDADFRARRHEVIRDLREKLSAHHDATRQACGSWLDETIAAYRKVAKGTVGVVETQSHSLWRSTVDRLDALDHLATQVHCESIADLMGLLVPEVRTGGIVVQRVARDAGYACKISVMGLGDYQSRAVGYCIGRNGGRVRDLQRMLAGESVTFIDGTAAVEEQIRQALAPARIPVQAVSMVGPARAVVHASPGTARKAIGRVGINVRLASAITGVTIQISADRGREAQR